MILLKTNFGDIKIELNHEKAPKTAANFESYVKDGFYDGLIFHRVIDGFMIQGGGFAPSMTEKPEGKAPIENEADNGLKNTVGTLAMARTSDPHSASSQFFINIKDNDFLNHTGKNMQGWGYCVFGKVVDGMDVINRIKAVKTTTKMGHQDVPAEDVIIEKAEIID
ncbi:MULTISPECIES: peptidylprolyl isomerase [Oceanospirillaceae]|jgi:peptidyl-prolyl cis-trans isomerase B (cyclophilin B)|uniref:Peptidyl-prolyl cis-trans isomerase n=1 Tax=Oceanobacter antarcticus TaxID=3133425 RepID=A0ABW8NHY1_9GAMM|tara:strand:- start:9609 stop:10106 length:498 start_codon:yes stop_codon:yes gene_type:complete